MSIEQPEKVATPELAAWALAVQVTLAPLVPVPLVMVSVTLLASLVTVLPLLSCTVTTGWLVKEMPPVELLGWVLNTSFVAVPAVIEKALLVAAVTVPSAAVSVYPLPDLSTAQPAKLASPELASLGFVVQVSVAPLGPLPESVRVTKLPYVVTVLPPASCAATTGCVANAMPLVELTLG